MFKFEGIIRSDDGVVLSARYLVDRAHSFFKGHFEGQPLMPAASQLQIVEALIRLDRQGITRILGGHAIKFVQQIHPNDMIELSLRYRTKTMIDFSIQKEDTSLASKGTLLLQGDDFGS